MTEGLPRGFVKTNEAVGDEIAQLDRARDDELRQLWKAYSTNKAVLPPGEGVRLENLFWRIWSNPIIQENMSGLTLANIFRPISRGQGLIIDHPREGDPLNASTLVSSHSAVSSSPDSSRSSSTVVPDLKTLSPVSQFDLPQGSSVTSGPEKRHSSTPKPLPPILKKSRTPSNDTNDTTRDQSPNVPRRSPDSDANQLNLPLRQGVKGKAAQSGVTDKDAGGRKRTSFGSMSLTPLRGKPSMTHYDNDSKSPSDSLPKSGSNSAKATTLKGKPFPRNSSAKRATPLSQTSTVTASTTDILPNSWQDVDSSEPDEPPAPLEPQPAEWLVDKNFRGKFFDSRKTTTSQTNLAGLGKNLSVRFLDQLPKQQPGESGGETSSSRAAGAGTPNKTRAGFLDKSATAALSVTLEGQEGGLPRTRSQLSIMVDHERKSGTLKDEPGEKARQAANQLQEGHESSSEEEAIVMGTGVGRTKVIKGGKKSDKRKDASAHYHSQIPDPVW